MGRRLSLETQAVAISMNDVNGTIYIRGRRLLPVLGFSNPGRHRSKLLILFCPADAREGYFEGLAELTRDGRQPTHEELVELMRKFDQYLVPGPSPT